MKPILAVQHVPEESLGNLETMLREAGAVLEIAQCFAADWPERVRAGLQAKHWSGLVVMGGPMNVDETDQFPFLATEVLWLREAVAAHLPILGVCLGGQLLAKALGARVTRNPVKEIGWYPITMLPGGWNDPLFHGSQQTETVFQWHGDTFELPRGATQLARGASCEQQAFRYGRSAWGMQFHLEMTAEMVSDWLAAGVHCGELASEPHINAAVIRDHTPAALKQMTALGRRVFDRFAAICREHSGG